MTQVHMTGVEKSRYKLEFLVEKMISTTPKTTLFEVLTHEFIGTPMQCREFIELKRAELAKEYSYVMFSDVKILPADSQLIFGDNKL